MRSIQIIQVIAVFALLFYFSPLAQAQERNCGTTEHSEYLRNQYPKIIQTMQEIERHTQEFVANPVQRRDIITIPVVFHIVYNNASENISDAQIQSQLDVLNEDFRRLNADADNTWSQGTDTEIEFCLASRDPNGNSTNGITRTQTTRTSFSSNNNVKFNSTGGHDAWPANQYMNFWVCDLSGGLLGYAQFPGGPASTDGIVCDYQYVGTEGTATQPFHLGRTATHEVGHYLNLRHIWGDGGCGVDDLVSDTPVSDASNVGCNVGHVSCGTVDMVQNYMDYSDDACMNLFTVGQSTRMNALFSPGGARFSLLSSPACGGGNPPSCNDGIQNGNETGVDCGGSSCEPCQSSCADNEVNLKLVLDNYGGETTWNIKDLGGNTLASGGPYINNTNGTIVTEDFCLPDGCFNFTIEDSYGDGICCAYGNGSYEISSGGTVLIDGGSFASIDTKEFCVGGSTGPTCNDGVQNGNETGVDCGGPDCDPCTPAPTCNDGVQNGNETGVDCGGPDCNPCTPAPTCNDGVQNGNETGVDCGGPDCSPCGESGCIDVTITIVLDNYGGETTWDLKDNSGATLASGGPYNNNTNGQVISQGLCLDEGCYVFTMNDSYGDGICCSYGNGSYEITEDVSGLVLVSGGSFGSSVTEPFCTNEGTGPSCNDGVQNGNETGVDCGGPDCDPCTPAPNCNDGIQNGNETGVDCGGPDCAPCEGGECSNTVIDTEGFEAGWGIWNDGGSDCFRNPGFEEANTGFYSVRLRDNSFSSVMTTDALDLSSFDELTVSFSYLVNDFNNPEEDFWLQISTSGFGYTTVEEWNLGDEFENGQRYNATVTLQGTFSSNTRIRFRCDASSNGDVVYIDDVQLSGCSNGSRVRIDKENLAEIATQKQDFVTEVNLFPNPTSDLLNVTFEVAEPVPIDVIVTDFTGKQLKLMRLGTIEGNQKLQFNASDMSSGFYFVHIMSKGKRIAKKFIVAK